MNFPSQNPLALAWESVLARRGGAPAIFSAQGEVLRSFTGIEAEARQWEEELAHAAPRGGVVALQIGTRPEWPALALACLRSGRVALPLGRHLTGEERLVALAAGPASVLIESLPEGGVHLVHLEGEPPHWPEPAPEFLKLTSGTTAAPRAIRFRAAHLLEDALQILETMGIGEGDLNYAAIPLSHSYGFGNLVLPLLVAGVPMAVSEDRLPRAILSGLEQTGATVFPGMPVFFDKLAALGGELPPLPRLRLCISAGAPLPPEVGQRFTARFGLKVHTFYGSSECGGIAYDADPAPTYREGVVGHPLSRVRLRLGEEGALTIQGPTVADGYWPRPAPATLGGGTFTPGDLLRREPTGEYALAGRVSDIINVAGRKLNPREVEGQLRRFPGVREVVVFGIPSVLRNEEPVACVVLEPGIREAELLHFARQHLGGWQVPKALWVVGEIPVNERGKTSRRELAARYLAGQNGPARS